MNKLIKITMLCFFSSFLVSCAANEAQGNDANYEETKKMIVDILKTDEGKKALNDILTDDQFKQQFVMDQEAIRQSIENTLLSDKGKEFWQKQMKDEKFAETFAKSTKEPYEEMMKDLMNDPEYQKKMMEILQNPEMEKNYTKLMKSNEFRAHLQDVMKEQFENPLFKAEIFDMLKKIADEERKEKGGEKDKGGGE